MEVEFFREYCLKKRGVTESFPFNETALVFKVMNKMFVLTDLDSEFKITLKCEPERASELREKIIAVTHAYHFNKKHWISLLIDGSMKDQFILDLIDNSYDLVSSKLSKKQKEELASM